MDWSLTLLLCRGIKEASALAWTCLAIRSVSWTVIYLHTWRTQTSAWRTSKASCSSSSLKHKQLQASWITSKTRTHTHTHTRAIQFKYEHIIAFTVTIFHSHLDLKKVCQNTFFKIIIIHNYLSHQQMVPLYYNSPPPPGKHFSPIFASGPRFYFGHKVVTQLVFHAKLK